MKRTVIDAELLIFDLDGTLIDSSQDIAWSANMTLSAMGHEKKQIGEIVGHIGWGVKPLLEKLMPGETSERIAEARLKFLDFYGDHLVVKTSVYPGVEDTIGHFMKAGKKLAVVTNKPFGLAESILEIVRLKDFFSVILGGDSLPNKKPHSEPIEKAMSDLCAPPEKTVVVGDSPVDCEAGKAAGAYTVGVSYGFRGRGELEAAGCDIIIDDFTSLKRMIR
ncbi:MAG: phosphoglycolate phosphatase [Deltaproteobacteria bacterium GWC2_55_46]|nr:MAG: phosphoglycolate phosphatase [Deltaproteobacteria bacterium GWA2_55_82]OGQ65239.1 MAG: phosphoglycolate phosphatase [Deltaproteobacteria bacterium RIFCSPLOWO2_02_FULL_55_12]OIJ74799.1 MAG: phosphoglycolate phosphatase [Deltaproteobacteria bacterium GWC2_55_46]